MFQLDYHLSAQNLTRIKTSYAEQQEHHVAGPTHLSYLTLLPSLISSLAVTV